MSSDPANPALDAATDERGAAPASRELAADEMPCPVCGSPMPDLKGGKATICPTCGFKDSCCF
jgi:uncharacterized Zn finger protein (UPF0148 family)